MTKKYTLSAIATMVIAALVGAMPSPAAAAADESVAIGTAGQTQLSLVPGPDGFVLTMGDTDGTTRWTSAQGAAGVRFQASGTVVSEHYDSVAADGQAVVATADVSAPSGTTVRITDSYSISADTLEVRRSFVVTALAAADAGRGFAVTFPLRNADAREATSYEWFAPGTWYGNSPETFTGRTKMAFDGVETALPVDALGAPLISAYRGDSDVDITLIDRTDGDDATIVQDKEPQNSKTLVDARFDVAGLGIRHVTTDAVHTEMFHDYPARNVNFRNRYAGKPSIQRYLPLSEGFAGDTGFAVRTRTHPTFNDAITGVWREAYAETAEVIRRVDTKIHFDTLVDYIDASYGLDQGSRSYFVNFALHLPQSGFLWRNADAAWVMLAQGWARDDEEMRQRARNVIDDQISRGGVNNGNPRTAAEAHTGVMRAYLEDKRHGVDNPAWLAKVRAFADSLPAVPRHYPIGVLTMLAEETGNPAYRAKAEAAADAAWTGGHDRMRFFGGLEDYAGGPPEYDRESATTALEEYMYLYRSESDAAKKQKWLTYARTAADYAETWSFVHDITMVPAGADKSLLMYGNEHVPAFGLSSIHAGAAGGDPWTQLNTVDYYELAEATGDDHYRDFAVFNEKNSLLWTNMGDKAGLLADSRANSGLGFMNEYYGTAANDYGNNNQRGDGNDSNIGWRPFGMLAMTQRTLDATGRYSLDEPSVSDIVGLDAYFRLVNKATGAVLDIADASRQNGAPVVATDVAGQDARTQQWMFQAVGDGQFKIVNRGTAKVLDIASRSSEPGAPAVQSVFYEDTAYRFAATDRGDGWYSFTNVNSGLDLELGGGRVQQNTASASDLQLWRIEPVGDVQLLAAGEATAITGAGDEESVTGTPFDLDATLAQRWSFLPSDEGWFGVVNRGSALALTATSSGQISDQMQVTDFSGFSFPQQWRVVLRPDGHLTLLNRETGRALGAAGAVDASSDESALRLQTAGPATSSRPVSAISATTSPIVAEIGEDLPLPSSVAVLFSDGTKSDAEVTWGELTPGQRATPGRYELRGSVSGTGVAPLIVVTLLPEGGIASIDPVDVSTPAGTTPSLPAIVTARSSEGTSFEVPVTWSLDGVSFAEPAQFVVLGDVAGSAQRARANVTVRSAEVREITSIDAVRVVTTVGAAPTLPSDVAVLYEDGSRGEETVVWADAPAPLEPGYSTVSGTVSGGIPVVARVTTANYLDRFTGDPDNEWTTGGARPWTVENERFTLPTMPDGQSSYAYAGDEDGAPISAEGDFVYEADVTMKSFGNGGLIFGSSRATDDRDAYYFGIEGHTQNFVAGRISNAAFIEWRYANAGAAPGIPHRLRVEKVGDTVSLFVDDGATPLLERVVPDFPSGLIGVRSYTAGMEVDNVVLRPVPSETAASPLALSTTVGVAPLLPSTAPVERADGTVRSVPVTWETVDPVRYASPGSFTTTGATGAGTIVTAAVSVEPAASIVGARTGIVVTAPGELPDLPQTARATYEDGRVADVAVTWDVPDASAFAEPGDYVEVPGSVDGTTVTLKAIVAVATYADDFSDGNSAGWSTYGGTWTVDAQSRFGVTLPGGYSGIGEKAVADGTDYRNMIFEADVTVTGGNDGGMIFRVTNERNGADAYNGYYVGISLGQRAAILGKANGSWNQVASATGLPGIVSGAPATVRVIVRDQRIQVFVNDMIDPVIIYDDTSPVAPATGKIGLRGFNTSFRATDVRVAPLPPISALEAVAVTTIEGIAPTLPTSISATRIDGTAEQLPVDWELDGVEFAVPAATVRGSVPGTDIDAVAEVTVLPAELTSTRTVDVITTLRVAPALPGTVSGRYTNGDSRPVDVSAWAPIAPQRYDAPTQFRVDGSLAAGVVNPRGVVPRANVIVIDPDGGSAAIVGFRSIGVVTVAGTAPTLPDLAVAVLADGRESERTVVWDPVAPEQHAASGSAFTVSGAVVGTNLRASADVTVTEVPGPVDPVPSVSLGWPDRLLASSSSRITYTASVSARGETPTGSVTVFDGKRVIATGQLVSTTSVGGRTTSTVKIVLPKLSRGVHLLWMRYEGSAEVDPSRSWPVPVLVW